MGEKRYIQFNPDLLKSKEYIEFNESCERLNKEETKLELEIYPYVTLDKLIFSKCNYCGKKTSISEIIHMRSGDESSNTIIRCTNCNSTHIE